MRFMRYVRSVRLRRRTRCDCRAIIIIVVYVLFGYYQSFTDVCAVLWLPFFKMSSSSSDEEAIDTYYLYKTLVCGKKQEKNLRRKFWKNYRVQDVFQFHQQI
ncbi:Hypothetical protein CINCED_3A000408 [Cinara cedri]|uniref:Uncharacterized protein n=1 Tax=Cinara cedri TaxID=506608 RepID=A0A5E4NAN2_9HEMI|nr:Hypothetical protein CINCED_3A000408 [Cinara cedri]